MAKHAAIEVRQPQPHDIVGDAIHLCGFGEAWEGATYVRVTDATGRVLAEEQFTTSMGTAVPFHLEVKLASAPTTPRGVVEVFGDTPVDEEELGPEGREVDKVAVPVVFGTALVEGYVGYGLHAVRPGDTLSSVAREAGGGRIGASELFEANRDQLDDPDVVRPGQVLRVPQ